MSTRKHTTTTVRTTEQQSVMEPVDLDDFLRSVNLDMAVYQRRLDTFKGNWKYENDKDAICTAEKLARAGFYYTEEAPGSDAARCYVCQHELLWDPHDEPWDEHSAHRPDCQLVINGKQDENEFTVFEQLQIMAFMYATRMYPYADEAIENLRKLMDKLKLDTERAILQR